MADDSSPSSPTSLPSLTLSQLSSSSHTDDEADTFDTERTVNEIATDFSKFLNLDCAKEETKFNDSVEMMLTKLDEFFSLVDMIRSDTSLCLTTTVPDIKAKCAEMEAIFEKIDKLEEFVNIVKECVAATEEKVTKAESDLSAVGGLVKKLTSFVSKKKSSIQSTARNKNPDFVPVKVFNTEEFFDHSKSTSTTSTSPPPQEL